MYECISIYLNVTIYICVISFDVYMCNFDVYVFGSMYKCATSMYMYAVRCTCMRYDVHMCNFDLYECGSIYIFLISMYIYMVRCLYVEFRCICVRFDDFSRNGTPYAMFEDRDVSDCQLIFEWYCTYEMTPGFKPFTIIINVNNNMILKFRVRRNH